MALTPQEIENLINTYIVDNNIKYVSPAKLRYVLKAINEAIGQTSPSQVTAQLPLIFDAFTNEFSLNKEELISTDASNSIELGTDGKLFSSGGGGGVGTLQEVTDLGASTTNAITIQDVTISGSGGGLVTNVGASAGVSNTGESVLNIGSSAGDINSGDFVTNIGTQAGQNNVGNNVINVGQQTGQVNTGNNVINIGEFAGISNAFDNVINLGKNSQATAANQLALNTGIANTAINLPTTATELTLRASASVETIAYLSDISGGGGATDLSYTPSPTDGTVTSSTGTDATIPLVDGTNAGLISPTQLSSKQDVLTASNTHTFVDSLTAMTTPVDADRMIIVDNSASLSKKITWANIKATLKTYFDTLYIAKNTAITGATKTKITYDANGLVTSGADATTSDIAEGSNLYFTNARAIASTLTSFVAGTGAISSSDTILTAIQKLAGNSGLKKVINDTTASANHSLTTEVVMKSYEITGGTFVSGSKPNFTIGTAKPTGSNATYTMRLYAGTTDVFASATLIGTCVSSSAFIRSFNFERRAFYFNGTTLNGFAPTSAVRTDITELSTTLWGGMTLNPANSIFLFVTLQNGSALDTTRINFVNITE